MRISGVNVEMGFEPRCQVCNHPRRIEIERMLLLGNSPALVLRMLYAEDVPSDDEHSLSRRGISRHVERHSPAPVLKAMLTATTVLEEEGRKLEEAVGHLVSDDLIRRSLLQQVYEDMQDGKLRPTIPDAIAVMKMQQDREINTDVALQGQLFAQALGAVFDIMRAELPPEVFRKIQIKLGSDQMLRGVIQRAQAIEASAEG